MHTKKFFIMVGICSLLSAIGVLLLAYLPSPEIDGFEAQVMLYTNEIYLLKLWISFFHHQLAGIAIIGIVVVLYKKYPELIIRGALFYFMWAFTEIAQQAYMIDAVNQILRPQYSNATDEATKAVLKTHLLGVNAVWDTMYFIYIYGLALGSILLGVGLTKSDKLGRWLGYSFIFLGLFNFAYFIRWYVPGMEHLSPPTEWLLANVLPHLQPIVYVALGVWLFQQSKMEEVKPIK
jgi:hypothetical protein